MPTMADKRAKLAEFVLGILRGIDPAFKIDTRLREIVLMGGARADRVRIMGDPVRYCVITHADWAYPDTEGRVSIRPTPLDRTETFVVNVMVQYKDHEDDAKSSQALVDAIVDGDASLIEQIAQTPWIDGAGALGVAESAAPIELSYLDSKGLELAHEITFTVTVE